MSSEAMTVTVVDGVVSEWATPHMNELLIAKIIRVSENDYKLVECQYDYFDEGKWHCYEWTCDDTFWSQPNEEHLKGLLYKVHNNMIVQTVQPDGIWHPLSGLYIYADYIYKAFMEAREQALSVYFDDDESG